VRTNAPTFDSVLFGQRLATLLHCDESKLTIDMDPDGPAHSTVVTAVARFPTRLARDVAFIELSDSGIDTLSRGLADGRSGVQFRLTGPPRQLGKTSEVVRRRAPLPPRPASSPSALPPSPGDVAPQKPQQQASGSHGGSGGSAAGTTILVLLLLGLFAAGAVFVVRRRQAGLPIFSRTPGAFHRFVDQATSGISSARGRGFRSRTMPVVGVRSSTTGCGSELAGGGYPSSAGGYVAPTAPVSLVEPLQSITLANGTSPALAEHNQI